MTTTRTQLFDLSRVAALLDRLDPEPALCDVAGCIHHPHAELVTVPAAAGVGQV